jgi:hypothetical protein
VWNIYKYVVHKATRIPNTMVEWDGHIPEFNILDAELIKAREAAKTASDYVLPHLYHEPISQPIDHDMPLVKQQIHMQNAIFLGSQFDSMPNSWIRTKEQFNPQEQLNVYINGYQYRLSDVVTEDYPVLKEYLGDDLFYDVIYNFIKNVQSTHFNIGRFALKLPEFLKQHLPKDKFAHELCHLETSISQLADFEETAPLEQKHLLGMTSDTFIAVKLYPRKALKLMTFTYPVNIYYQRTMDKESTKKPRRKASYLAVFRHEDIMWRMDLEQAEYELLTKLFSGKTVGEALDDMPESATEKLSEYFSRWMRNGILAAYEYNSKEQKGTYDEVA